MQRLRRLLLIVVLFIAAASFSIAEEVVTGVEPYFPSIEREYSVYDDSIYFYHCLCAASLIEQPMSLSEYDARLLRVNLNFLNKEYCLIEADQPVLVYELLPHIRLYAYGNPIQKAEIRVCCPNYTENIGSMVVFKDDRGIYSADEQSSHINQHSSTFPCLESEHKNSVDITHMFLRYICAIELLKEKGIDAVPDITTLLERNLVKSEDESTLLFASTFFDDSSFELKVRIAENEIQNMCFSMNPRMTLDVCGYIPSMTDGDCYYIYIPQIIQ